MDFLNFLMALSPIVVVLVGILGFKKSAKTVSPIALAWTLILAFTYFNLDGLTFAENVKVLDPLVWKGIKEGLKIVLMVFGAFTILNLLRETGAIEDVKATIAQISDDRRVQVVIIGMMLPIFLEGAAGAGAPAAIAAPFLVALGFNPTTSIAIALLGDATPASFGGAGLTTINGGAALVGETSLQTVRRELREETGAVASELIPLGPFYPTCAYSTEVIQMFLARGLSFGERELDEDEFLNVFRLPLRELVDRVLRGEIPDAKTQAAALRVWCMLQEGKLS